MLRLETSGNQTRRPMLSSKKKMAKMQPKMLKPKSKRPATAQLLPPMERRKRRSLAGQRATIPKLPRKRKRHQLLVALRERPEVKVVFKLPACYGG